MCFHSDNRGVRMVRPNQRGWESIPGNIGVGRANCVKKTLVGVPKVADLVIDAAWSGVNTADIRMNIRSSFADSQSRARVFGVFRDMLCFASCVRLLTSLTICGSVLIVAPSDAAADDVPPLGAIANHDHDPIHVRSKPVIERLPVKVIEPVDLKISSRGRIFVADRKAECVFRLDEYGGTSLPVRDLANIQRIQVDTDESLFVLTSTGGESSLHQVTASGQHVVLATLSFPATAFVRDTVGYVVVAAKNSGRLLSVSPEGVIAEHAELSQPAVDLAINAGGQVEALLASGHIVTVAADGRASRSGFAPIGAIRLMTLADGSLLTLSGITGDRAEIVSVSRHEDRPDRFNLIAHAPAGTRAVSFDAMGNLCLANPDLRAVTKVTSQFSIPCPHCGKPTRMIFSTNAEPAEGMTSRSF